MIRFAGLELLELAVAVGLLYLGYRLLAILFKWEKKAIDKMEGKGNGQK